LPPSASSLRRRLGKHTKPRRGRGGKHNEKHLGERFKHWVLLGEFKGNSDNNTEVAHRLLDPNDPQSIGIVARYLRIQPTGFHVHKAMRVGVYGSRLTDEENKVPDPPGEIDNTNLDTIFTANDVRTASERLNNDDGTDSSDDDIEQNNQMSSSDPSHTHKHYKGRSKRGRRRRALADSDASAVTYEVVNSAPLFTKQSKFGGYTTRGSTF